MIVDVLCHPAYRAWRHLFIVVAILATGLSQSFFVFGDYAVIPDRAIYAFGIAFTASALVVVYINRYYLAPRCLPMRAYATYSLVLLAVVLVLLMAKHIGETAVFSQFGIQRQWNGITLLDSISNTMLYTICIASTSMGILLRQLVTETEEIEGLQNRRLKGKIQELKQRVQPKFLYSTLAYAADKVVYAPQKASDTLFKLSELLRYQLYDSRRERVLLAAELSFLHDYLALHRQNSDERFSFELSVNGNTSRLVAPSALIPCVEEVMRHRPSALYMQVDIEDAVIRVQVSVSGMERDEDEVARMSQKLSVVYGNSFVVVQGEPLGINFEIC